MFARVPLKTVRIGAENRTNALARPLRHLLRAGICVSCCCVFYSFCGLGEPEMKTVRSGVSRAMSALLIVIAVGPVLAATGNEAVRDQQEVPAGANALEVSEDAVEKAKSRFADLGLSLAEKQKAYRGLIRLGHAREKIGHPDFLIRLNTIRAVRRFQTSIGAAATGYLSEGQLAVLQSAAGEPFDWETVRTANGAGDSMAGRVNPFTTWRQAGYTQAQKGLLYRALHNRGFVTSSVISTDLTSTRLRDAIRRYQATLGAPRTGYLSPKQVEDLLNDPGKPTAWERSRLHREKVLGMTSNPDGSFRGRTDWQKLAVSDETKRALFRSLYDAGFFKSPDYIKDFSYRMEVIRAVEAYQVDANYPATGFLTQEQVNELLERDAPPTPYELQQQVYEKYGESAVMNYISELVAQELGGRADFKLQVTMLQKELSFPATGYLTEELIERSKELRLKPAYAKLRPQIAILQPREKSSVKDWRRWEVGAGLICEIATIAIEVEGFLGSTKVPALHFRREQGLPKTSLGLGLELVNWDLETISMTRVGGQTFHIGWDGSRHIFTSRNGKALPVTNRAYGKFVRALMRSNGLEVKYRTVFGTEVIANFSALGFTKQLRAIQKACAN